MEGSAMARWLEEFVERGTPPACLCGEPLPANALRRLANTCGSARTLALLEGLGTLQSKHLVPPEHRRICGTCGLFIDLRVPERARTLKCSMCR